MSIDQAVKTIDSIAARIAKEALAAGRSSRALGASAAAALATAAAVHGQTTLHVDDSASGSGGDGRTWSAAHRDLQDALAAARTLRGGPAVIKIAGGVYAPDRGTGDRSATFLGASAISLLGGFAGLGAGPGVDPDARDPRRFVTVLTGDLARNDGPGFVHREDNSFHVLTVSGLTFEIDGLTIRGGFAREPSGDTGGGAVLWDRGSGDASAARVLRIANCALIDNAAIGSGGAILATAGPPVELVQCELSGNTAGAGGAAAGSVHAVSCSFTANSAGEGGAVHGYAVLSGCTFLENTSTGHGGAVFASADLRTDYCLFAGNSAAGAGGAVASVYQTESIQHSTFSQNRSQVGGAVFLSGFYGHELRDSILWGNSAPVGAELAIASRPYVNFAGWNDIAGGRAGVSSEFPLAVSSGVFSVNPRFVDPLGPDGSTATVRDNDYRLRPDSPCIDLGRCRASTTWSAADIDLAGMPRYGPRPCTLVMCSDLGPYEYQYDSCGGVGPAVHVRVDAAPNGDGRTWETAYRTLQAALNSPLDRPIWLTGGAHRLDAGLVVPWPGAAGVNRRIVGGFAGNETSEDQRVAGAHPTTICGSPYLPSDGCSDAYIGPLLTTQAVTLSLEDLTLRGGRAGADGQRAVGDIEVESLTRVRIEDCSVQAGELARLSGDNVEIDGLVVQGTTVAGTGKAMLRLRGGSWTIRNSVFQSNSSFGISCERAFDFDSRDFRVTRCSFIGNSGSEPTLRLNNGLFSQIDQCTFKSNRRTASSSFGGAIANGTSTLLVSRSSFVDNWASVNNSGSDAQGGAIWSDGPLVLDSCLFAGNFARGRTTTGAAAVGVADRAEISNCTFVANRTSRMLGTQTGAVSLLSGGTITSSIFWNNQLSGGATTQAAQLSLIPRPGVSAAAVRRCIIQEYSGIPTASEILDADPSFVDPIGPDNLPGTGDETYALLAGSHAIDRADGGATPDGDRATDFFDADNDGDTAEPTPLDLTGSPRLVRAAGTPASSMLLLDLGAFEFQQSVCAADWNGTGGVSLQDLFDFLNAWLRGVGDFDHSGTTDLQDVFDFVAAYLAGCA